MSITSRVRFLAPELPLPTISSLGPRLLVATGRGSRPRGCGCGWRPRGRSPTGGGFERRATTVPCSSACVSMRQHASAYASIRQHTSAYVHVCGLERSAAMVRAYVSIRQHTSAYASIRQHTPAYVHVCGL
jgi:hypothetical protein